MVLHRHMVVATQRCPAIVVMTIITLRSGLDNEMSGCVGVTVLTCPGCHPATMAGCRDPGSGFVTRVTGLGGAYVTARFAGSSDTVASLARAWGNIEMTEVCRVPRAANRMARFAGFGRGRVASRLAFSD